MHASPTPDILVIRRKRNRRKIGFKEVRVTLFFLQGTATIYINAFSLHVKYFPFKLSAFLPFSLLLRLVTIPPKAI